RVLEGEHIRNTALKFRLRSIIQKFHTYSTYWNRTMREIENGTYRRHKQRAQRRAERRNAQAARFDLMREQAEDTEEETEEQHQVREQKKQEVASAADEFLASL